MWETDETGAWVHGAATYALSRGFSEAHLKAARWGFSHADDALITGFQTLRGGNAAVGARDWLDSGRRARLLRERERS